MEEDEREKLAGKGGEMRQYAKRHKKKKNRRKLLTGYRFAPGEEKTEGERSPII